MVSDGHASGDALVAPEVAVSDMVASAVVAFDIVASDQPSLQNKVDHDKNIDSHFGVHIVDSCFQYR